VEQADDRAEHPFAAWGRREGPACSSSGPLAIRSDRHNRHGLCASLTAYLGTANSPLLPWPNPILLHAGFDVPNVGIPFPISRRRPPWELIGPFNFFSQAIAVYSSGGVLCRGSDRQERAAISSSCSGLF